MRSAKGIIISVCFIVDGSPEQHERDTRPAAVLEVIGRACFIIDTSPEKQQWGTTIAAAATWEEQRNNVSSVIS
jgi:hypothetical protein